MGEALLQVPYVTSLEEVAWGGTLVAITMTIHAFGMLGVLRTNQIVRLWASRNTSFMSALFPVLLASWMIMLVHLAEVVVWAAFFFWQGAFENQSVAYYFSLNAYTTLGSTFNLPYRWRLLEGMIATAGLLTFAWSTGILVTLGRGFQEQTLQYLEHRYDKKPPP